MQRKKMKENEKHWLGRENRNMCVVRVCVCVQEKAIDRKAYTFIYVYIFYMYNNGVELYL